VRSTSLELDDEEHVLLLTIHHSVSDGWSMGVRISEIAALYSAFSNGRPSLLGDLPLQYADFAVWQRQWLQGQVLETQLAYWTQQLANIPLLQLPTDRPRPAVSSFQGARLHLQFPQSLSAELRGNVSNMLFPFSYQPAEFITIDE